MRTSPRRIAAAAAAAALCLGGLIAQAEPTPGKLAPSPAEALTNAAVCRYAAVGTFARPGHSCDTPPSVYQEITGEAAGRKAGYLQKAAIASAPDGQTPAGALATAIAQRQRILANGSSPLDSHAWVANGRGPLQAADAGYTGVNGLGLVELGGRVTDFTYDKLHRVVYASVAYGGVWKSVDAGAHWVSVGESLPTQIIGSVAYSPAAGGTLIAVSGDGSFGSSSLEGAGIFRSTNGGKSWQRAKGGPDSAFGFRVAVDPGTPSTVYVATGAGLFRSTDDAVSFRNVALPTGDCAGKSNRVKGCLFANQVTDVVVQVPGGSSGSKGGAVLAAVGWRQGTATNPDGSVQSPANGLYSSADGQPGTFARLAAPGFTQQDRIGRIGLGNAVGPAQNHDIVYALVQNASALKKDLINTANAKVNSAYRALDTLDGVFFSPDFGKTWVRMADGASLQSPTSGSALSVVGPALANYGAGVQAWYNNVIRPDPTRAVGGVPTRLLFGIEEVWQNENTSVPQAGPSSFRVVGRYFSGRTCLFLELLPACPTNREEAIDNTTTTHPDQHALMFVPNGEGGVRLFSGNDGGVYTQSVGSGQEFTNNQWGKGNNQGFNTLSPYYAARAKDGTIWMGLQDNGTVKIEDVKNAKGKVTARQRVIEALGGDGFFTAVNPDKANEAYGEYVGGAISATVDGGRTWNSLSPPITHALFSTPFRLDPLDPKHLLIGGREIVETGSGPGTSSGDWTKVYDLGTAQHPGDANATETSTDSANTQTALDLHGANAYAAFCGVCDVLLDSRPFKNGIATNVSGKGAPKRYTSAGWHIAAAKGLPNRYITSIVMDPNDPKVVYASVGSYARRWTPPGTLDRPTAEGGHVYKSIDAGEHFTDISANLPNAPVNAVTLRGDQLLVGTDVGAFASRPGATCGAVRQLTCGGYEVLGHGLPSTPVASLEVASWDSNLLTVATTGRGAYTYRFGPPTALKPPPAPLPTPRFRGVKLASYDFESGLQGWVASTNDPVATWRLGPPGHASSQSVQVVPYTNSVNAALVSPTMALPARSNVEVSWWRSQDTEPCCDGLTLDWSSDGHVWHTVSTTTNQNKDYPNFSQDKVRFVAPAGQLLLRFRMTADTLVSSPPYTGVRVDDVVVSR